MKYEVVYKGVGSTHALKHDWRSGLSIDLEIILKSFSREYAKKAGLNPELPVTYGQEFIDWFLENKFVNFQHMFVLRHKEDASTVINKVSGKVSLETDIKTSSSFEQAQDNLIKSRQQKTVTRPSESVQETVHNLVPDVTIDELKSIEARQRQVMTGDDTAAANKLQESIVINDPNQIAPKALSGLNGPNKVVSLEPKTQQQLEQDTNAKVTRPIAVFDPAEASENIKSRATIVSEPTKAVSNISLEVTADSKESTGSVLTPNTVQVALDPTLDSIIRNPDLADVSNIVKTVRDKGLLQKAKALAKNRGDHARVEIIEDRLRVM